MDASRKLTELKSRKFGDDFQKGQLFENFTGKVSDQLLYVTEAMRPVAAEYTRNTYTQCERVQNQLKINIGEKHSAIEFDYQGSVPLNLHIKRHSDTDMLVVTGRYHWVTPPLTPAYPYLGDAKNDLIELRNDVVLTIRREFPEVEVDNTGGKAVAICGGSLNRKIDLVPSSWVLNANSQNNGDKTYKGIKLYDKKTGIYVENYPFLHIYRCNAKDSYVSGKYKKVVRYVKNVRKDSDKDINISSYDATALMYHMDNQELNNCLNDPARLSALTESFLSKVLADENFQRTARVPNDTRLLFGNDGLNVHEVFKLYEEVKEINRGIVASYLSMDSYRRSSFDQYFLQTA